MANGLSDKVALVTGGGLEKGRAAVLEISPEAVEELKELGSDVKAIQGDATGLEDNERALSETVDAFGRLDALVCCVGLGDDRAKMNRIPKEKMDEAFDEIFAVNVRSYVFATKVCADLL